MNPVTGSTTAGTAVMVTRPVRHGVLTYSSTCEPAEFSGEESRRPLKKKQVASRFSEQQNVIYDSVDMVDHPPDITVSPDLCAKPVDRNLGRPIDLFSGLFTITEKLQQFKSIENETMFKTRELIALVTPEVASDRISELHLRGLDDDQVAASLLLRKQSMTHIDNDVKVQDSMLQLFRVLMRRKVAVLSGHRLPPLDSVFSK